VNVEIKRGDTGDRRPGRENKDTVIGPTRKRQGWQKLAVSAGAEIINDIFGAERRQGYD